MLPKSSKSNNNNNSLYSFGGKAYNGLPKHSINLALMTLSAKYFFALTIPTFGA